MKWNFPNAKTNVANNWMRPIQMQKHLNNIFNSIVVQCRKQLEFPMKWNQIKMQRRLINNKQNDYNIDFMTQTPSYFSSYPLTNFVYFHITNWSQIHLPCKEYIHYILANANRTTMKKWTALRTSKKGKDETSAQVTCSIWFVQSIAFFFFFLFIVAKPKLIHQIYVVCKMHKKLCNNSTNDDEKTQVVKMKRVHVFHVTLEEHLNTISW